jgi:hypothetical protein
MSGICICSVTFFYFTIPAGVLMQLFLLSAAKQELFPVADATTFFTDLHHINRVAAAGNIRTLSHHRLQHLEHVIILFKFLIMSNKVQDVFVY